MDFTPKDLMEEFKKLESGDFGFFIFSVCGSICPGVLAIWLFNPDLIVSLTTPKLVVLSISIMLPFITLNSWIFGMTTGVPASTPKEKTFIQLFLQGGVLTTLLFSICLSLRFLLAISLFWFGTILAIAETFFLLNQLGKHKRIQEQNQNSQETGTKAETTDKTE